MVESESVMIQRSIDPSDPSNHHHSTTPTNPQQIRLMRREIANAGFALFGFVLALLVLARIRGWACLARYHHRPRTGTLASLLNSMIQALFVLNAIYAFAFVAVAVVEVGYLTRKGHAGSGADEKTWEEMSALQGWEDAYGRMSHVLQQLSILPQVRLLGIVFHMAMQFPQMSIYSFPFPTQRTPPQPQPQLPQFWHCALAWIFYAYIVQGRTAAALERIVRERVVWYWFAAVLVATGVSAVCFYARPGSKLHLAEVRGWRERDMGGRKG